MTSGRPWRTVAVGGVAAVLFGLAVLLWPGPTLTTLLVLFAAYAIVAGVLELVAAYRAREAGQAWLTHGLLGVAGVVAGVVVLGYPSLTGVVAVYAIAIWALAIGLIETVSGFTRGQHLVAATGLVAVVFGLVLLADPSRGFLAYAPLVGVFAIVRGALLVLQALQAPAPAPS